MRWWDGITDSMDMKETPGDGEGQGSLACCSPRGCRELDTEQRDTSRVTREVLFPARGGREDSLSSSGRAQAAEACPLPALTADQGASSSIARSPTEV